LNVRGNAIAQGDIDAKAGQAINVKSGQLGAHGNIDAQAGTEIAAQTIIADKAVALLSGAGDIISDGIKAGGGDLRLTAAAGSVEAGELVSFGSLSAQAGKDLNVRGNAIVQGDLDARAGQAINVKNGQLGAHGNIDAQAGTGIAAQTIIADKAVALLSGAGDIISDGIKAGGGDLQLMAAAGSVNAGDLISLGNLNAFAGENLTVSGNAIAQGDIDARAGQAINIKNGQLGAHGNIDAQAGTGIAAQTIIADKAVALLSDAGDIISDGIKAGGGDLRLTAAAGSLEAGELVSFGDLLAQTGKDLNVRGNAIAQGDIDAKAGQNLAAGGAFIAGMNIAASAAGLRRPALLSAAALWLFMPVARPLPAMLSAIIIWSAIILLICMLIAGQSALISALRRPAISALRPRRWI